MAAPLQHGVLMCVVLSLVSLCRGATLDAVNRSLVLTSLQAARSLPVPDCSAFGQVIHQFTVEQPNIKGLRPLSLKSDEITFTASFIHAFYHFRAEQEVNLLVFGVGLDSLMWHLINCRGRTAFVEDDREWFDVVTTANPLLEAYLVEYRASMRRAEQFLVQPWLMEMPTAVDNECWDVIVIDAPAGDTLDAPGRLEPIFWAGEHVKWCLGNGGREVMYVFVHNAGRRMETTLINAFLIPIGEPLGFVGKQRMAGFRFTPQTLGMASNG